MTPKTMKFPICVLFTFLTIDLGTNRLSYFLAQGETASQYLPLITNQYPPLESGKIVFVSTRDGSPEIYKMNYDGSNVVRLTNNSSGNPDWSPDGTEIVFISDRSGASEIYRMDTTV